MSARQDERPLEEQQQQHEHYFAEHQNDEYPDKERRLVDDLFKNIEENVNRRSERIHKRNEKDLDGRIDEENNQYRRHLSGLQAQVTMHVNKLNDSLKDHTTSSETLCR